MILIVMFVIVVVALHTLEGPTILEELRLRPASGLSLPLQRNRPRCAKAGLPEGIRAVGDGVDSG